MEFFTCECMLDKLINMTQIEIVRYIFSQEIFSLSDSGWLIVIQEGNNLLFFCIRFLNIIKPFLSERIFCLKRSAILKDTCLEFMQFSGVNNCCQNCLEIITAKLKKNLILIKK